MDRRARSPLSVQDRITIEERLAWLRVRGHPDPAGVVGRACYTAMVLGLDPVQAVRDAVTMAAAALPHPSPASSSAPPRRRWWPWGRR